MEAPPTALGPAQAGFTAFGTALAKLTASQPRFAATTSTVTSVLNFTFVPWFRSVAPYIQKFRNQTFVVGIAGGSVAAGRS